MLRHSTGHKLANDGVDTRALRHCLGRRNVKYRLQALIVPHARELMSTGWTIKAQYAVVAFALLAGDFALAKTPFVLASGRRDPRIYAIDLNAALKPENNNTPNAIISRSLVARDGSTAPCSATPPTLC